MRRALPNYSVVIDTKWMDDDVASDYTDLIEGILNQIGSSTVGRAVLAKIKAHGWVVIVPYSSDDADKYGVCNALSRKKFLLDGFEATEFDSPVPVTGIGTEIAFSPKTWGAADPFGCAHQPGSQPDDVLIHELIHAGRRLGGDMKQVPLTGSLADYDSEEEFFAVMVTNIDISEAGRQGSAFNTNLVANHGVAPLNAPLNISEVFMLQPGIWNLVDKYCTQHPNIVPMIAQSPAQFNPVRTYFAWKAVKYKPRSAA